MGHRRPQRVPCQPRHQELQNLVGTLGRVRTGSRKKDGAPIYGVSCVDCTGYSGTTYRPGKPNDFEDALYRWVNHLRAVHRDVRADCLRFRREAYEYAAGPKRERADAVMWEAIVASMDERGSASAGGRLSPPETASPSGETAVIWQSAPNG